MQTTFYQSPEFELSYNSATDIGPETAIVIPNDIKFLDWEYHILSGDHRESYNNILQAGGHLPELTKFFLENAAIHSPYTDLPSKGLN